MQNYNSQIANLRKKHLKEQQELEQKLLLEKQQLERLLSESQFYSPPHHHQQQQQQNYYDLSQQNISQEDSSNNNDYIDPLNQVNLLHQKAATSRHVSSVISHFTSNSEGYKRLAQELDGFLIILSSAGNILFASNSCSKFLGIPNSYMTGQNIAVYLHPDDEKHVMASLIDAFSSNKPLSVYCRFKRFSQENMDDPQNVVDCILMEMNGRPVYEEGLPIPVFVVNIGREYKSKTSADLDSILTLRLENIKLRLKLKSELEKAGKNPESHPLLNFQKEASSVPAISRRDSNHTLDSYRVVPVPESHAKVLEGTSFYHLFSRFAEKEKETQSSSG